MISASRKLPAQLRGVDPDVMAGVPCPFCSKGSRVMDSRGADSGRGIRRRRICVSCHKRFTTYEMILPSKLDSLSLAAGLAKAFDALDLVGAIRADLEKIKDAAKFLGAVKEK